jgi:PAS domain S-box-containing protein
MLIKSVGSSRSLSVGAVVDLREEESLRVLHVDNDATFLKVAEGCLEAEGGFHVDTALSVEKALAMMKKESYDAVISGYIMPGKDGLDFLKELREAGDCTPFIMFTGKGREEIAVKALNLGADGYFSKVGSPETVYGELAHGIRQIVESRRAEEALRRSESYLKAVLDSMLSGLIVIDAETHEIVDANAHALRTIGTSKEDAVGKVCHKFVCPAERGKCPITDLGQTVDRSERVLLKADGDKVPILKTVATVTWRGHKYLTESFVDITERKHAERAMVESQQNFKRLFMNNPEATVHLDAGFHVLDVNPRFTRLFGHSLDEVKGRYINDVIVPSDSMEEAIAIDKKASKGETYHEDTVRRRKDGSLVPVAFSAAPIIVEDQVVGHIAVYKDISQLKKAEEESREAMDKLEKMNEKLRVVGGLTRHDSRNKLSAITCNVYLAKKKLDPSSEVLGNIEEIESAVGQIVKIFEFAKIYELIGVEELRQVDIEKMIDEAVSLFSDLKGVKVVNDCHGLTVLADSLLRQLFYNLIDNSLKYGDTIKTIKIRFEESGPDKLRMIFEDDGAGIGETEKKQLFQEGSGKGTGYGLYLIRKMCDGYGWSIQEDGKEGEGVRFIITIPRTDERGRTNFNINSCA